MKSASEGMRRSLLVGVQRALLDEIGRELRTAVIYLKGAWSDPVLYGGRGARTCSDIDILVEPARFDDFAGRLAARGFQRHANKTPTLERWFGHKEWSYQDPTGRLLPVDLHRGLCDPIWYDLPTAGLLARAVAYPGSDGPIVSLSPEDQILHCALHYAGHLYRIDGRHLEDCRRLLEAYPVDWTTVEARARAGHLRLALAIVVEALRAQGARVPAGVARVPRLRRWVVGRWVEGGPVPRGPDDGGLATHLHDVLLLRPLLSDRIDALPRALVEFGLPWLGERILQRVDGPSGWSVP